MEKKIDPIRETTDEARSLAKTLIRSARFASLAVLEPETGYPIVSRVGVAADVIGARLCLRPAFPTTRSVWSRIRECLC